MGSMNWLGFSLSPQELPASQSHHHHHHHHQDHHSQTSGFNSDEISGTDVSGECFDLASDSAAPSLNLPPPFGIFEAFNRNNQPQDWNMKGLGMNYKTTSEFCMLMGTTPSPCSSSQDLENQQQQQPKLENLLGRHSSFADHDHAAAYNNGNTGDYMFPSCSLQLPSEAAAETPNVGASGGGNINGNNSSSIGLSMIKTWLRNQPAPTPQENKNDGGATTTAQTLSLSMSTGSQSSSALSLLTSGGGGGDSSSSDNKQQPRTSTTGSDPALDSQSGAIVTVPRKSVDTFGQRTSIYRGVTRHRWTGRYEAHLWDNSCRREGQTRKGRQVYLGGYDKEEKAARAYDLAALKYWGTTTTTNFPISNYEKEVEEMKHMTRQEYVASLRRKSSGFSRGASIYRGVTRHHQHGRWQARIGRVAGNKDLYLGTFSTQEEAAEAYDIAAIKFRGLNAVTNFDMSRYDVKSILESSTLPIGGAAKRLKDVDHQAEITVHTHRTEDDNLSSQLTDGINNYGAAAVTNNHGWPALAFQQSHQPFSMHYPYQRVWCKQEVQDSDNHGYQDHLHHQYQTSTTGTHNFFHQPNSVLHNLMGMDSTTAASNLEQHSSGSNNNSVIYGNGGHHDHHDHDHHGDGNGGVLGYGIPMATVISNENQNHGNGNNIVGFGDQSQVKAAAASLGYENLFGSADPYHGRNLYYLPQQSAVGPVKAAGGYDHQVGSACNNWVPIPIPISTAALPTLGGPRSSNMAAVCHGAQTFTVWNDT